MVIVSKVSKLDGTIKWHLVIEVTPEQKSLVKSIAYQSSLKLRDWLFGVVQKEVNNELEKRYPTGTIKLKED